MVLEGKRLGVCACMEEGAILEMIVGNQLCNVWV